jgi:hypothetical protein
MVFESSSIEIEERTCTLFFYAVATNRSGGSAVATARGSAVPVLRAA